MRPENRCRASGRSIHDSRAVGTAACWGCGRPAVRVKLDGTFYVHSRNGR